MPKWVIHHTADAFTAAEKQQIANGMTQIYSSVGLPRFYSHAHFIEFPTEDIYSGGLHFFMKAFDDVMRPVCKPKNIMWESAIYEGAREYWRINGLIPPSQGSETEKQWAEANRIVGEDEMLQAQPRP
ncbi:unnamed protein product [Clonostachys rosea f. rosea IK726]|uniref:Uncharacterized protein n=1 Tax=Clonostachys rosea f. rosea IK726 TaxID=1349383 RepID=A0ACA9UB27_BIOOC|nr:unnamed protein product [Clonostachys rosea f. rosea IK726]